TLKAPTHVPRIARGRRKCRTGFCSVPVNCVRPEMSTVAATDPIAPEEEEKARSKRADFLIARHPRIESVDIGGTKIAVGAVREDAILDRLECRTNSEQGRQNAKHTG